jgi:hypothetical protein
MVFVLLAATFAGAVVLDVGVEKVKELTGLKRAG